MSSPAVAVNARYLLHRVTGIQRYAREIVARLPASGHRLVEAPDWAKGAKGHLWEQLPLHARAGRALLWNPCQTGPVGRRRQVVTVHDMGTFDHPGSYAKGFAAWYRWCMASVAARAEHVIAVSTFTKERLLHHVPIDPERVTVVLEGADARFRRADPAQVEALRRRLGIGPAQRIVLSLGSLEPRKNLAALLQAWQAIGSGIAEDALLVLVGKRGDPAVFRGLGVEQVPARVLFTGYLPDEDLPAMYTAATAFVYPSLYEGFGLPVLEAMSCGTPVVTSNLSSLPEVAGDAALLVNPRSAEELQAALRRCLDDADWLQTAAAAGLRQAQRFSWDRAARETWDLLAAHA
ncbi:MAG: glycosyltransferase family 4 protein [Burkholderiaceae bacterium]|nr:glycosyltransferase family 4 protein [Burkholderiaceae bacterium]